MREQVDILLKSLLALGTRRLIGVGSLLVFLMAGLGVAAVYLNRPAYETLYVGLDRDDVNRVGIVLSESGLAFDVDSSGSTAMVEAGMAGRARMILAEKGLPASSGSGYELFDKLGSLGLTSFMQEVTRVRALEGEIARSIQAVNGVKAARVHIVIPDRTSFRDRERKATASILIRAESNQISSKAQAIRHLVAAAVPGLSTEDVTVMDSAGNLLASGQDQFTNALTGALETQRTIENDIEEKISQALGPQLGAVNYRVSVQARINTDNSTTQETIFDPASRVERSVQVAKAEDSSTQKTDSQNVSVEKNLPTTQQSPAGGPQSSEKSQKREETTNYEINSKRIDSQRNGYRIEKISISIVLNRKTIVDLLGKNAAQADIDKRLAEIQKIAITAAGFEKERGDQVNISALDFVNDELLSEANPGMLQSLAPFGGTVINALAFIVVALLLLHFGFRPLLKAIAPGSASDTLSQPLLAGQGQQSVPDSMESDRNPISSTNSFQAEIQNIRPQLLTKTKISPAERLKAMTELDVERTARVLRKWLLEEAA